MMQKSTTFTTIFHLKKSYFHYDFGCKKMFFVTVCKIVICTISYESHTFFHEFAY
jgi:hypothetical protein